MPREVRPELEALIATGNCNCHSTVDIVLTGGVELHLSSGEIFVNRFGITRQYLAKLNADGIQPLEMSLAPEVDQLPFACANADMIIGRTLTGPDRRLDGARGTAGVIFIDPDDATFGAGQHIYDAKLPGEIVAGEISDEQVAFTLLSDVDAVTISGRTIASEFQWREPISVAPQFDPNDNPGGGPGGGLGGGGGCFVAGTPIKSPSGPQPIETFIVGSPIRVMDFDLGRLVDSVVTRVEIHPSLLTRYLLTENGRFARLTDEQPLYTGDRRRFDRLELLRMGDPLGCLDQNDNQEIDCVESIGDPQYRTVHHLHVAHRDHNYVLDNGIIAHNMKGRYGDIDPLYMPLP